VQRKLHELGYLPLSGVDGVFGAQSRTAVIAFQKWEGLARDGIPGPITQNALASAKRPAPVRSGGGTRIEILLDRQLLLLVRNGDVLRTIHVSTGKRGFVTPAGDYAVLRKRRRSWSIPYKVWLPWASYFVGGIAVHQSRFVPVRPVSHGCVRVTRYDARWLFRRTPVGTPVTVVARSRG
jgi:lipoprotein-anchoring transpeptidase ErfK/SrfK